MNPEFIAILQKLVAEQGKEALLNAAKCKSFLSDYTRNEYKRESRFLLQALDVGVQKAIDTTDNIAACKKQRTRQLQDEYGLDEKVAAGVVDMLALVLRGDDPKSKAEALIEKGKEYDGNGDEDNANKLFDEAINILNEVIKLDKNDSSAYAWRGEAYYRKGQFDDAINDCSEAIMLDPSIARAYACRGLAYYLKDHSKDQWDVAIRDLSEAIIRLNPDDGLYIYSKVILGLIDIEKRIEDLEKKL